MKRKGPVCLGSLLLTAVLLTIAAGDVLAQRYPTNFIKVLVPAPPGGGTDILARIIGEKLTKTLGQPVVIDNRGGQAVLSLQKWLLDLPPTAILFLCLIPASLRSIPT